MRVLLTRPLEPSKAFAKTLRSHFEVIISPLIEIRFRDISIDFGRFEAVAFTSQNGVRAYQYLKGPSGVTAYCVGDKTAEFAASIGLHAVSAKGTVEDLDRLISQATSQERILHLSGAHRAGTLHDSVIRVTAYDQIETQLNAEAWTALGVSDDLVIPLFSPRTAQLMQKQLYESVRSSLHVVCLSASVAAQLDPKKFSSLHLCDGPTAALMRDKMSEIFPAPST